MQTNICIINTLYSPNDAFIVANYNMFYTNCMKRMFNQVFPVMVFHIYNGSPNTIKLEYLQLSNLGILYFFKGILKLVGVNVGCLILVCESKSHLLGYV
jgi:hypothetical protein